MASAATSTSYKGDTSRHMAMLIAKSLVSPIKGGVQAGKAVANLIKVRWGRSFKNITNDTVSNNELYPTKAKIRKALWKEVGEGALNIVVPFLSTIALDFLSKDETKRFNNKVRELEESIEDRTCLHEFIVTWTVHGEGPRPTEILEAMKELVESYENSISNEGMLSSSERVSLETKEIPQNNDAKNNYLEEGPVAHLNTGTSDNKVDNTPRRSQSDGVLPQRHESAV